jgi:hypothetical protein
MTDEVGVCSGMTRLTTPKMRATQKMRGVRTRPRLERLAAGGKTGRVTPLSGMSVAWQICRVFST